MVKKFFVLIFVGVIASLHAYDQNDVNLVLNPKCMSVRELDLRGADLSDKDLGCKVFISVDFRGANLGNTSFDNCCFIDCIFVDAIVERADFQKAVFIECNLLKMVGVMHTPVGFLAPRFDPASEWTLSGRENVSLYCERGFMSQSFSPIVPVSGLCRRIFYEAERVAQ